jgi:TP901 family phage tail tape measure protein
MATAALELLIQLKDEATASLGRIADSVGGLGNVLLGVTAGGIAGLGAGLASAVSVAGDFEAGMNQFASAAGDSLAAAGLSVDDFRNKFIKIGQEMPVSTMEVQQAAIALIKGGLDPAVVAAGGLEASLQFAAAAGMGLVEAADLSIKQLGTFVPATATAAEKTAFLANAQDLLVKAAGASTLDVAALGDAMLAAGGQAQAAGLEYQDFVTTMGVISPAFGSAAEAGTSFKNFLTRLQPTTAPAAAAMEELGLTTFNTTKAMADLRGFGIEPMGTDAQTLEGQIMQMATAIGWTKKETDAYLASLNTSAFFDQNGAFIGGAEAAQILQNSLAGLTDAQRVAALQAIFGNDAMAAANALANAGAQGYDAFAAAMGNASGVAATAAATQQGLNIAWDNFKGTIEALQIVVGSALLPVLTSLLNDVLSPAVGTLGTLVQAVMGSQEAFNSLSPTLQQIVTIAQTVFELFSTGQIGVASLTAVMQTFGNSTGASVISTLQSLYAGFQQFIAAIQPVVTLIQANLMPILAGLATVLGGAVLVAIGSAVAAFVAAAAPILALVAAAAALYAAWQSNFGNIQGIVSGFAGVVQSAFSIIAGIVTGPQGARALDALASAWQAAIGAVQGVLGGLSGIVQAVFGAIASFLQSHSGQIQAFIGTTWTQIAGIVQTAAQLIQATIIPIFQGIASFIQAHGAQIQQWLGGAWQVITSIISGALSLIQGILRAALAVIQGDWAGAWSALQAGAEGFVTGIVGVLEGAVAMFGAAAKLGVDAILGVWQAFTDWAGIGGGIIDGIVRGIVGGVGKLVDAVGNAAQSALNAAKSALGISSPSKLFATEIGTPMIQGIGDGIEKSMPVLERDFTKSMHDLVGEIGAEMQPGGERIVEGVAQGVKQSAPELHDALRQMLDRGGLAAAAAAPPVGEALIGGIAAGIESAAPTAEQAVASVASGLVGAAQSALDISSPSRLMAQMVGLPLVEGIAMGIESAGPKAVGAMLDLAGKLVDVITRGVDAFGKLRMMGTIPESSVAAFTNSLQTTMTAFGNMTLQWDKAMMSAASQFTYKSGQVVELMSKGVEFLTKLADLKDVPASAIAAFTQGLQLTIQGIISISTVEMRMGLTAAQLFAESAMKVVQIIEPAVVGLTALAGFASPGVAAMDTFALAVAQITGRMIGMASRFRDQGLAAASQFAETAGTVLGIVKDGVEGLTALAGFVSPGVAAMDRFALAVAQITGRMIGMAFKFKEEGLNAASAFADAAGNVIGIIGDGVAGLAELQNFVSPGVGAIQAFALAVFDVVNEIARVAVMFSEKGLTAAKAFADAGGAVVGMMGSGVDAFLKLADFQGVGEQAVNAFAAGLRLAVAAIVRIAATFQTEALDAASRFADAGGKVTALLASGVEAFIKLADFTGIPTAVFDLFAASVRYAVQAIVYIATLFTSEALASATRFAQGAQTIVSTISNAIDTFTKLGEFEGIASGVLDRFTAGLAALLGEIQRQALPAAVNVGANIMNNFAAGLMSRLPAAQHAAQTAVAVIQQALRPLGAFGLGNAVLGGGAVTVVAQPSLSITFAPGAFQITTAAGTDPAALAQHIAYQVLLIIQQRTGMRLV